MSNPIVIACLVAIFSWWFSTGIILVAVRLCDRLTAAQRQLMCLLTVPIFALGLIGIEFSAPVLTTWAVYQAFFFRPLRLGLDRICLFDGRYHRSEHVGMPTRDCTV